MKKGLHWLAPPMLLLVSGACSTPCQDLANRICDCQQQGALRDACNSAVSTQIGFAQPSGSAQSFCQSMLNSCPDPSIDSEACQKMQTQLGKQECGLAYPGTDGGTFDGGTFDGGVIIDGGAIIDGGTTDGGTTDGGTTDGGTTDGGTTDGGTTDGGTP